MASLRLKEGLATYSIDLETSLLYGKGGSYRGTT
jgi:hypothetical protein